MKKGRAETMTHDYKRNGTTTLFAALDVMSGEVMSGMPASTSLQGIREVPEQDRADRR